jgi:cytidine deaminase
VGCALLAGNGKVYVGSNIKNLSSSPTSICAETAAIASMFAEGERKIKFIAAVHLPDRKSDKWEVLQPCGACRHIIGEFGNPWIAISKAKKARLADLYPLPVRKK